MSSALTSQRAGDGMLSAAGAPDVASGDGYVLPTWRGIGAQTAAALGLLTGLWVAFSPYFITLQHHGTNAATSDLIAGLAVAAIGAVALASPRGFPGLEFGNLLLGAWLIIAPFVLAEKFSIATSMYWSNIWAGSVLMALALAGLATLRRPAR